MTIYDHELPGYLVVIIFVCLGIIALLALAFLGYLPSPLSSKLDAHDDKTTRADRASLIACGAMMEVADRTALNCFDNTDPRSIFVGTR